MSVGGQGGSAYCHLAANSSTKPSFVLKSTLTTGCWFSKLITLPDWVDAVDLFPFMNVYKCQWNQYYLDVLLPMKRRASSKDLISIPKVKTESQLCDPVEKIKEQAIAAFKVLCSKASPNQKAIQECITKAELQDGERFKCTVCLSLIQEPVRCSECDVLFCKECLDECCKRNSGCPHCQHKPMVIASLTRNEQHFYENQLVSGCPNKGCEKYAVVMTC